MRLFLAAAMALILAGGPAGAALINNGDLAGGAMAGGGIVYGDLAGGPTAGTWHNNKGTVTIAGEQLVLAGVNQKSRTGIVFNEIKDLAGADWKFQFDAHFTAGSLKYMLIYAGVDDGDNTDTTPVMGLGADSPPYNGVVVDGDGDGNDDWTLILDLDATELATVTGGTYAFDLEPGIDLGDYDLAVIRFAGGGVLGSVTGTMDNFQFIPEPASLVLLATGGLLMVRRRR